jgi:hypothetical protein
MPKTSSPAGFMLLLAALLWIAGVAYFGFSNAPQLPLDSGNDAETQAALNAAQSAHWLKTALTALLPPAVLLVALKFLRRS